ncbi:hypothetical protein FM042_01890 [Aliidiomarina halalkaliphila]|uniref:Alginate export domain-containing protein n=1 Tax=Aliidiomarina halalkaliphila TaxID=2593535 RepID=A0A552X414_9GAMM|nr:alginate export family protein [Aliidiomarina halalkaliphila]TRW49639.1 hypothetical protein FM042_01890 [Aliidiomarina halalkaliphila]
MLSHIRKYHGIALVAGMPLVFLASSTSVYADDRSEADRGKVSIDFRYRLEHVEQTNPLQNALASTLRTRVNAQRALSTMIAFQLEIDHVEVIGDDRYNSTVNLRTDYSVVADPRGTDINQALISIRIPDFDGVVDVGRMRINHLNQRFLGGVGWRQNEQTFDGVRYQHNTQDWRIDLAYIQNVNRVFGPKGPAANERGTLFTGLVQWQLSDQQSLRGYMYDFDFSDWDIRDSQTYGIEYHHTWPMPTGSLQAQVVAARQNDAHQHPQSFSHHYHRFSATMPVLQRAKLELGSERLAGDGISAFQTPLATLHAFQGFTDLFLVTPNDGLRDHFAKVSMSIGQVPLTIGYHQFYADTDRRRYGDEWNITGTYRLQSGVQLLGKFADYRAKSHAVDTRKAWFMVSYTL